MAKKTEQKSLLVVESPAKAKTISKYLGKNYTVKASVGHVVDLPHDNLGVDIEKNFQPSYIIMKGKNKVLSDIFKAAQKVDQVFLAPDPDREGEAIAKHIHDYINKKFKKAERIPIHRILVNEITSNGIKKALANPLEIDINKFESQQARRILDRLVGYQISPLLWKKVRRGLSAGRVQSVAVRLVVEKERAIQVFVAKEYWVFDGEFFVNDNLIKTKLFKINGEKFDINNQKDAEELMIKLEKAAKVSIDNIEKKARKRNPQPPFITSKLQQDAARKLKFTSKRTMGVAQSLYEGVELGDMGAIGLITYMRTDSVRVSPEAQTDTLNFIKQKYGKEYVPGEPNIYKSKKSAQDAHEAIRPTSVELEPEKIKKYLSDEQYKLYSLIWNRFVASQMTPALYDQTTIDFLINNDKDNFIFRATGSVLKFAGYEKVYLEYREDEDDAQEGLLPECNKNDAVKVKSYEKTQKFTQPPARYNEATIVKELEENGIGRPSTYASIISTIQERDYVEKEAGGQFKPTELGFMITDLLVESFPEILDVEFTAGMENSLDDVEEGKVKWVKVLKDFYVDFEKKLKKADKEMRNIKGEETPTEVKCPECESIMNIKWGRMGQFLACSNYPDCKTTRNFVKDNEGSVEIAKDDETDEICPICNSNMTIKQGRFGRFLACSKYPECKGTKSISTNVKCPECKEGDLVERRTRKGKLFYSCSNYPTCKCATWNKPVAKECPECKSSVMTEKGSQLICINKECGHKEDIK